MIQALQLEILTGRPIEDGTGAKVSGLKQQLVVVVDHHVGMIHKMDCNARGDLHLKLASQPCMPINSHRHQKHQPPVFLVH